MIIDQPQKTWEVIVASVQGFSHLKSGIPNQDHADSSISPDGALPAVVAVADGHGSLKSTRSEIGSAIAVREALAVANEFLDEMQGAKSSQVKGDVELGKLQRRICERWQQEVKRHFASNPLQGEHDPPQTNATGSTPIAVLDNSPSVPLSMYGTTLLLAILTRDYLICLQIGDGDILAVFDSPAQADMNSREAERLIPKNEANIANETDSLCMPQPLQAFRTYFRHFESQRPSMVFLSTDGYYNSFASDDSYLRNCVSLFSTLQSAGVDEVRRELPTWLSEYSQEGSGDDISVGIIVCKNAAGLARSEDHYRGLAPEIDDPSSSSPVTPADEVDYTLDLAPPCETDDPRVAATGPVTEEADKLRECDEAFSQFHDSTESPLSAPKKTLRRWQFWRKDDL